MPIQPLTQFHAWLSEASAHPAIKEPTAMTLATANASGVPSARIVLLKEASEAGFTFYTNLESRKSRELKQNPHAALVFYWMPLDKQVRIEGTITEVSAAEADAYFATRGREKQLGAWASRQSETLPNRTALEARIAEAAARFPNTVPRPAHWSGWRLSPQRIEFWIQKDYRLHERELFTRNAAGWESSALYP
jgi:pyridoxamine 5'-phosphate oxidase